MFRSPAVQVSTMLTVGIAYWWSCIQITNVKEPWDAANYLFVWYPVSLALSAAGGLIFRRHSWLSGVALTLAQLPVMWMSTGIGPLWPVGLIFLSFLAIPAVASSILGSRVLAGRGRNEPSHVG